MKLLSEPRGLVWLLTIHQTSVTLQIHIIVSPNLKALLNDMTDTIRL